MLIDRSECDVGLPSLDFEEYPVSPMLHLKLQAELVGLIFKRFGPPKILDDPNDIEDYQVIMEDFMKIFPPEYAMNHPNTTTNNALPWIALHRHYMHTCTLAIALGPFRTYMAKTMTKRDTPAVELKFRQYGVNYALKLMDAVHRFFEYVWTRDTTFHFVPFCIFDTAALLCSAILHDEDSSMPQRGEITDAIAKAFNTLRRLRTATATAKAPYDVLRRLIKKLPVSIEALIDDTRKKRRFDPPPPPPPPPPASMPLAPPKAENIVSDHVQRAGDANSVSTPSVKAPQTSSNSNHSSSAPVLNGSIEAEYGATESAQQLQESQTLSNIDYILNPSAWPQLDPTEGGERFQAPSNSTVDLGFQSISDAELGDLAMLWNWQSLDLGFTSNPIYQE